MECSLWVHAWILCQVGLRSAFLLCVSNLGRGRGWPLSVVSLLPCLKASSQWEVGRKQRGEPEYLFLLCWAASLVLHGFAYHGTGSKTLVTPLFPFFPYSPTPKGFLLLLIPILGYSSSSPVLTVTYLKSSVLNIQSDFFWLDLD